MIQKTVILIGSQGSGKGTQAKLLEKYLENESPDTPAFLFGTGAGFRSFAESSGKTNALIKEYLSKGELLPEFLPIWLWTKMFIEKTRGNEHIIFDGSPRTELEAQVLESAFEFYNRGTVDVVKLNMSRDLVIERMLARGRADDHEKAIRSRIAGYEENIGPALSFFENNPRYKISSVNGEQNPEAVHLEIVNVLTRN